MQMLKSIMFISEALLAIHRSTGTASNSGSDTLVSVSTAASSNVSVSISEAETIVSAINETMDFVVPQEWQVPLVVLVRYCYRLPYRLPDSVYGLLSIAST